MKSRNPAGRLVGQLPVALCGVWLIVLAARADDSWILAHVALPSWFLMPVTVGAIHGARAMAALLGVLLVGLVAPKVGRWSGAQRWRDLGASCARIAFAAALAIVVSETILRHWDRREPLWRQKKLEFQLGQPDPRFGWVLLPHRSTASKVDPAHDVHYRVDAWGDRSGSELSTPDPSLPTLVVTGESIAFGHGLEYEETFPAILGNRLGLQMVNVAAGGYGSDQAYLRLVDALDRLERPVAALTVFLPVQLGRGLQDYRPRLVLRGEKLVLEPPAAGFWSRWRLRDLLVNEVPYLSEAALSRALDVNAAVMHATALAARARGAEPLFLVPSFGPRRSLDEHPEAFIVRRVFEHQELPFLIVDIDPARIMAGEKHPDALAARQIADAVEQVLRPRLYSADTPQPPRLP